MSAADGVGAGLAGGPLGIISWIAQLPTFGKTYGSLVDTVDPGTGIPYPIDMGVENPMTPTDPTSGRPPVISQPGPPVIIAPGYPVPVSPDESSTTPFYTVPTFDGMQRVPLEVSRPDMRGREVGPYRGKPTAKGPALIGVLGRAAGMIGGLLYPSDLGNSDLFSSADLRRKAPKRQPLVSTGPRKRYTRKSLPKSAPRNQLPGIPVATKVRSTPTFVPSAQPVIPGSFEYSIPLPAMPRVSSPRAVTVPRTTKPFIDIPKLLDYAQPILLALATPKPKTVTQRLADPMAPGTLTNPLDPLTPIRTGLDPLTVTNTYPVGFPVTQTSAPRTAADQCRDLAKRRKPTRKCVERDDCNKCIRYAPI